MVVTAAGLQTCVGAEWGQSCADFHPLQLARLLSTCIIDLQIFNVARSLLLLWRQAPELAASVSLSLTPTLTLTLTLTLSLTRHLSSPPPLA